jgi:catalase (peroxidase I)
MTFFVFLFTVVYGLHHGELARIKVDIAHLIDTFTPPPGFFLPARALMLGFHDAGTWSETTKDGGAHATQFYDCLANTPCEQSDEANAGLGWARDALETVYVHYKTICSRADFWQIAAIVAISKTGGPEIPFRWGRTDATSSTISKPDRLPVSSSDFAKVRSFLGPGRLGFTDKEIVAFLGSHTLGSAHLEISGHRFHWDSTPHVFDNGYFQSLVRDDWVLVDLGNETYQWEATRVGPKGVDKVLMLISDLCLKSNDPFHTLNTLAPTNQYVHFYAQNEAIWKKDFANVWVKMSEAGQGSILRNVLPDPGDRLDLPPDAIFRKENLTLSIPFIIGVCVMIGAVVVLICAIIFVAVRNGKNPTETV